MMGIRAVSAADWPAWRALRLAALTDSPAAFGSTLAEWSGDGDREDRWRARLSSVPLNLIATLDGVDAAMVSAAVPHGVELISLWVAPAARGRGVGDALLRHVLAWATDSHGGRPVTLSVRRDNAHAIALYRRHGFANAGPSPDGPDERLMCRDPQLRR